MPIIKRNDEAFYFALNSIKINMVLFYREASNE